MVSRLIKLSTAKLLLLLTYLKKKEEDETLASQEMNKDRAGIDRPSE